MTYDTQRVETAHNPEPDDYMDLWRLVRGGTEPAFVEILARSNAAAVSQCPLCGGQSFKHSPECWIGKMQRAEKEGEQLGVRVGSSITYKCDVCRGIVATVVCHPGHPLSFTACKASIGCPGSMRTIGASVHEIADVAEVRWLWGRPSTPDGLSTFEIDHCTTCSGLVLRRASTTHERRSAAPRKPQDGASRP